MFEIIVKPEYQHILLNHLPIIGLSVALLVLVGAAVLRQQRALVFTLFLVAGLAGSAWPTFETGEAAHDRVESMLYSEGQAWLEYHHETAEKWIWVYYVTAVVAAGSGVVALVRPQWTRWAVAATLLAGVLSLAAGIVIAESGGKIRHPEFRTAPLPPAKLSESKTEYNDAH